MNRPADDRLFEALLTTLTRPRATFASFAGQTSARPGASAIAVLGMAWGLLSFLLWYRRHSPHAILLPIPAEHYYLLQALLMLPLLTGLWWLFSEVSHRLAGPGPETDTRVALGFAYAAPMTLHIGAEGLAYLLGGIEYLALIGVVTLPLTSAWVWGLCSLALREHHGASWPRSIGAAFVGLLVQAVAGSLLLR